LIADGLWGRSTIVSECGDIACGCRISVMDCGCVSTQESMQFEKFQVLATYSYKLRVVSRVESWEGKRGRGAEVIDEMTCGINAKHHLSRLDIHEYLVYRSNTENGLHNLVYPHW